MVLSCKKIELTTLILPRLEVFFLESWITHHLKLGVTHINIHDNGLYPIASSDAHWKSSLNTKLHRRLLDSQTAPQSMVWERKPHLNYFEEYSDEYIMNNLHTVIEKFPQVSLTSWIPGKDHDLGYPESQQYMLETRLESDDTWLLNLDPDEYLNLGDYKTLTDFITNEPGNYYQLIGIYGQNRSVDVPIDELWTVPQAQTNSRGLNKGGKWLVDRSQVKEYRPKCIVHRLSWPGNQSSNEYYSYRPWGSDKISFDPTKAHYVHYAYPTRP